MLDLGPNEYREIGRRSAWRARRGLAKLLYLARHPVLAFVTYQKAYPDEDTDFQERQGSAILFGLGIFIIHKLTSG